MSIPRTLHVHYFGQLREQRGQAGETLLTPAATPAEVYEELRARRGFGLPGGLLRFAVGDDFVPPDHRLQEGDHLHLMPPVAGG